MRSGGEAGPKGHAQVIHWVKNKVKYIRLKEGKDRGGKNWIFYIKINFL